MNIDNTNDFIQKRLKLKNNLIKKLINLLCEPNNLPTDSLRKRDMSLSYIIGDIIIWRRFNVNYHKLANDVCKKLLDNKYSVKSIDLLISSNIANIFSMKLPGKKDNNYINEFKRNLMMNIRICIAQISIDKIKNEADNLGNRNRDSKKHLKNQFKSITIKINKLSSDIYTSLITILGIFVAIMAATFGSIQLFGRVFNNIKDLSHISMGKDIILGSIILFGTYFILMVLFNGIARLIKSKNYHFTPFFTFFLNSCISILFLLGTMIAYPKIYKIIDDDFKGMLIIGSIIIFIILINIFIVIYKYHILKRLLTNVKAYIHKHMHRHYIYVHNERKLKK